MSRPDELAPTLAESDPGPTTPSSPAQIVVSKEEDGRYVTEGELGRGAMGRVLLVTDRHLDREVAMKLLSSHQDGDGVSLGALARFVREARVTGRLEHPGIVPVHELGQRADGTLYYTMKRIRGRSLADVFRERRSLAQRLSLVSAFRDVCEAVAYAHARGVIHRDLKPANVMVGEFGETLVVDWGLAKLRDGEDGHATPQRSLRGATDTVEGSVVGTPAYMSPEQARGELELVDERSDVWSLGVILFELLTGHAPFEGESAMTILARVLTEQPPRVRAIEPRAPPELAAIADRALRCAREARYANATEIAADVAAWQDGRAVRAYEYSSWELVRRFVRRNRTASAAALAVLASILISSGLVYRSYLGEQRERTNAVRARDEARTNEHLSRRSLAEAMVERAERAFDAGDGSAAAIYAAAALDTDPGATSEDERDMRRARDRRALAYSIWHAADRARGWELVRRIDADASCAIAGRRIVCPARDGLLVEEVASGAREHVRVEGVENAELVERVDGRRVLVVQPGPEKIVELEPARATGELPAIVSAAFGSEYGAAITPDGEILVLRTSDLAEIGRFAGGGAWRPRLLANEEGHWIAYRTRTEVLLWSLPRTADRPVRIATGASPRYFAFSPDGRWLAIPRNLPSVLLVDVAAGSVAGELPTPSWVGAVAWLDASRIAIGHENNQGVEIRRLDGGVEDWLHPASDGAHILHSVGEWLVDLPEPLRPDRPARGSVYRALTGHGVRLEAPVGVLAVELDEPRARILVATSSALRIYRPEGALLASLPIDPNRGPAHSGIVVAPDGAIATITTDGAVHLADPGGSELRIVMPEQPKPFVVLGIALSPDGDVIFAGTPGEGAIRRFSRSRGILSPLRGHRDAVLGLAVSPDGRTLASASLDGTLRLWHLDDGDRSEVIARQEHLFSGVAFSPDGTRIVSGDGDGWIAVYKGTRRVARSRVHEQWINRVAWWPDGRWVVSASDDGTVRVSSVDGRVVDRIVPCSSSCLSAMPTRAGDALYVPRDTAVVRIPLSPGQGVRDPRKLLRRAEQRAGVRLDGLELVPIE